jgi:mono/diheme cytochrome c family protein
MPRIPQTLMLAAALLSAASGLRAQTAEPTAEFAPGPGVETVRTHCAVCHPPTMITGKRKTTRQWGAIVDQMIGKGAQVSETEYDVIVAYLSKVYGAEQQAPG